MTLVELAAKLQASIYDSVEHSTYTAGVDVMQDLNQRDKTPGRAVAPYVFASVLGMEKNSAPNPFNWFGKTPLRSSLTTPNVWIDQVRCTTKRTASSSASGHFEQIRAIDARQKCLGAFGREKQKILFFMKIPIKAPQKMSVFAGLL